MSLPTLLEMSCQPRSGPAMDEASVAQHLRMLGHWRLGCDGSIEARYRFQNFHQTMAFANAVAWIAHREDHHPELSLSFNRCTVVFSTHSVQGLSLNDFICAAKTVALGATADAVTP